MNKTYTVTINNLTESDMCDIFYKNKIDKLKQVNDDLVKNI